MAITLLPNKISKKLAPKKLVEKLVTQKLTLNRAVLTLLSNQNILDKKETELVAIKVINQYKEKYKDEKKLTDDNTTAYDKAVNDKKLMVQRIQNDTTYLIVNEIKKQYKGDKYIWLPSDALVPDPLHQLRYGKKYTVGVGEMPGDRYGCKCGMRILTTDNEFDLDL